MKPTDPKWKDTAAAMVKFMIRARRSQEPGFIDTRQWRRWWNTPELKTTAQIHELLDKALRIHDRLAEDAELSSVVAGEREIPTIYELIDSFIDVRAVKTAIRESRRGESIMWNGLANWEELQRIRDGLDRLGELTKPKKVGRPPVTEADAADRKQLVEAWRQASEAKTRKKDFCVDRGIIEEELDRVLDWERKQKPR